MTENELPKDQAEVWERLNKDPNSFDEKAAIRQIREMLDESFKNNEHKRKHNER